MADPFATLVKHFVDQGFNKEEVALALMAQKGRQEGQDIQVSDSEFPVSARALHILCERENR